MLKEELRPVCRSRHAVSLLKGPVAQIPGTVTKTPAQKQLIKRTQNATFVREACILHAAIDGIVWEMML